MLIAAAVTPGSTRTRSSSASAKRARLGPSGYSAAGSVTRDEKTSRVAMPGSKLVTLTMLRTTRPETTSSANDSAISPTTSQRDMRPMRRLVDPRPSSFSNGSTSPRDARSAGTRPATSAASTVTAVTKSRTVPSMRMSSQKGGDVSAMLRVKIRTPACAMATPSPAPVTASTNTSTSVLRITWPRDAPRAVRTATSRVRSAARASTRFATLTQAMTSTSSTAASIALRRPTVSEPMNSSTYGLTSTVMPLRRFGSSCATCAAIVASSADAESRDASSRSRPMISTVARASLPSSAGLTASATHSSWMTG